MTPDHVFSISNSLAMAGWIILIFLRFWKTRDRYVFGIIILLLAATYSWLIFSNISGDVFRNFSTLSGVSELFANKNLLLAGWIHYLAFDLLAGIYIINNAAKNNINHWMISPLLLLTFLFGPAGLLLYYLVRWIRTKNFFAEF